MAASKQDAGVGRGGDPDYTEHLFAGQDPYLQKGSSLYVRVRGAWRTAPPAAPSPRLRGIPTPRARGPQEEMGKSYLPMNGEENNWNSPSGGPIPRLRRVLPHEWG